jgi:DNA repair exonuclease SbcCD ATPase subunit
VGDWRSQDGRRDGQAWPRDHGGVQVITKVAARNFLSWQHLDRDITPGVTLIDGWNEDDQTPEGSGKSAILNAICWALYGKIPKDANIDDVIKEGEKTCEVAVTFSDGVVIRRSRKPNELLMLRNGQNVKGKDARETQLLIEEYVALSFETFCQTIYFAQGYTKKFITANQEEKGKILSEVQDLGVFDKAGKEVRSLIKMEEDAITKLKHSQDLAAKDIELTKRDILAQEMAVEHARQAQAQRVKSLTMQIENEERSHAKELLDQAEDVADLARQIQETQSLLEGYQSSKAELLQAVSTMVYDEPLEKSFQEANNQLMGQVGAINAELKGIDQLVAKRANAEAQGKRYAARYQQLQAEKAKNLAIIANPTKNCPTCNAQLEACDTSHAAIEIARIDEEAASIIETLNLLSAEIDVPVPTKEELNARLREIGQQRLVNDAEILNIRSVKDKLTKAGAHLTSFDRSITEAENRIFVLNAQKKNAAEPLVTDTTKLDQLKATLTLESQPLTFDSGPLDALKIKLANIQSNLEDLTRLIAEKNVHMTRLEALKGGFKEIKSYVFNSMLNEINARVQKYLVHLFEVPVSVRFRNEDMKIETDVIYDGSPRGLGLLSGGQFRRVSLAVDLALSDVITARKGARVGVLILDEYFKDLSESSMEKCLTLLEGRGQPVLLIEHNSIFKNIVNNSVMVRLENGTSSVQI